MSNRKLLSLRDDVQMMADTARDERARMLYDDEIEQFEYQEGVVWSLNEVLFLIEELLKDDE